jgi:hypothetical protein
MTKDELLTSYTGYSSAWWFEQVQTMIQGAGDWENQTHPICDTVKWQGELAKLVEERMYHQNPSVTSYDENMRSSWILATVLAMWASRLSRAKAHDPRRVLELRRRASGKHRAHAAAVVDALYDETQDAAYMDQPWEYPHAKGATDGDFV